MAVNKGRLEGREVQGQEMAGALTLDAWRGALAELLKAYHYARSAERDVWDFAVESGRLRALGLTETDFRWLVCTGYARHSQEITRAHDAERRFRPTLNLSFCDRTCFVLTEAGASCVSALLDGRPKQVLLPPPPLPAAAENGHAREATPATPVWHPERRELRVKGRLVKRFRWPAVNQEAILAAFEEEAWPPRIDDPLPPQPGQDPKRRLHDTIKHLNRNQKRCQIHFRGDGSGEGIVWELIDPDE